jgi:hypothetical protein
VPLAVSLAGRSVHFWMVTIRAVFSKLYSAEKKILGAAPSPSPPALALGSSGLWDG